MTETITIEEIREILPHRYPFLLVDRVLEVVPGKRCVGVKNVTINESFFQGHFPGQAIMPGVLILESMAQVGLVMMKFHLDEGRKLAMLGGVDNARFKKPVVPGDQLINEINIIWFRRDIGKVSAVARVDGEIVAEAEITFVLVPQNEKEPHATEAMASSASG